MDAGEEYTDEERLDFVDVETDDQANDQAVDYSAAVNYDLDLDDDVQMDYSEDPIATGNGSAPEEAASDAEAESEAICEGGSLKFRLQADLFVKNYTRQKKGICINAKKKTFRRSYPATPLQRYSNAFGIL